LRKTLETSKQITTPIGRPVNWQEIQAATAIAASINVHLEQSYLGS
jgi:hypothetical protein